MTLSTPIFTTNYHYTHTFSQYITTTNKYSATTLITPLPLHLQFLHNSVPSPPPTPPPQPTNSISPQHTTTHHHNTPPQYHPTQPPPTNSISPNTPTRPNYRKFSVVLSIFCCPPPQNYNTLKKRKKTISRISFCPPLSFPSQRTP